MLKASPAAQLPSSPAAVLFDWFHPDCRMPIILIVALQAEPAGLSICMRLNSSGRGREGIMTENGVRC